MRVALFSDLHLEFSLSPLYSIESGIAKSNPDVIILAGDITTTIRKDVLGYIRSMTDVPMVYVPGNHEFYGTSVSRGTHDLMRECDSIGIRFAMNEVVTIAGVSFICCVGWSDLKSFSHIEHDQKIQNLSSISDFRVIEDHTILDMIEMAEKDKRFIQSSLECVAELGTVPVIVTHFSPIESCRNPNFPISHIASYFSNDWRDVLDTKLPKVWMYGHTHSNVYGNTLGVPVVTNQYGYPGEHVQGFDPEFIFEV